MESCQSDSVPLWPRFPCRAQALRGKSGWPSKQEPLLEGSTQVAPPPPPAPCPYMASRIARVAYEYHTFCLTDEWFLRVTLVAHAHCVFPRPSFPEPVFGWTSYFYLIRESCVSSGNRCLFDGPGAGLSLPRWALGFLWTGWVNTISNCAGVAGVSSPRYWIGICFWFRLSLFFRDRIVIE